MAAFRPGVGALRCFPDPLVGARPLVCEERREPLEDLPDDLPPDL